MQLGRRTGYYRKNCFAPISKHLDETGHIGTVATKSLIKGLFMYVCDSLDIFRLLSANLYHRG